MRNYFPNTTNGFLQVPIEKVPLNDNCDDEMTSTLRGIQNVYSDKNLCHKILDLIKKDVSKKPEEFKGCKGLSLWEVFIFAIIRRTGNTDYRKLANLASNHLDLIGILGHGSAECQKYAHSTIQENVVLVQPATLDKINVMMVKHALQYCKKPLESVRVDSFVFEANIHHHADYKSLVDGARCLLREGSRLAQLVDHDGFRQRIYLTKKIKNLAYTITQKTRSKIRDKEKKENEIRNAFIDILEAMKPIYVKINTLLEKAINYIEKNENRQLKCEKLVKKIKFFLDGTLLEHDLAHRRIVLGEIIESKEKIFSIFKPDTEIICKGKTKAPIEYGHAVVVGQCNNGFMLKGKRMENDQKDKDICIPFAKELQENYEKKIMRMTYDKAYRTDNNAIEIVGIVPKYYLPSKGKKQTVEHDEEYYAAKHWHSGVESSINALEQGNNMGVCRDNGLAGFDRCVAASIIARNMLRLGVILLKLKRDKLAG